MATSKKKNSIRVPKPSPDSFNASRPLPKHLRAQVEHLAEALKKQLVELDYQMRSLKTEGEAAGYIKKVTLVLHALSAKD
jgi:peptidoglycan hydrolase CwlO-like protein